MKFNTLSCLFLSVSIFGLASAAESRFFGVHRPDGKYEIIDREAKVTYAEASPADVDIHLYTTTDQISGPGDLIPMQGFTGDLDTTTFDPSNPSYIFIHGWTMNYTSFKRVLPLILTDQQANVFIVDYPNISNLFYTLAIGKLPSVADILANALKAIETRYSWDFNTVYLIGHSMGGQMSGLIGAKLDGALWSIQALDPAGPLFEGKGPNGRLDPTDAQFVQVIHTNGGLLGYRQDLGHADYHPNGGGMNQAGCDIDLVGICAHFRAIYYYYESIGSDQFIAQSCQNYLEYKLGACANNPKTSMGGLEADRSASGSYYLDTNPEEPYAQG